MNAVQDAGQAELLVTAAEYASAQPGAAGSPPNSLIIGAHEEPEYSVDVVLDQPLDATWEDPVIDAISELTELVDGWNGPGSRAIENYAIEQAISFLLEKAGRLTPAPSVVPTNSGGIALEWHQDKLDIEVEFDPNWVPRFFIRDHKSKTTLEGFVEEADQDVAKIIAMLTPTVRSARA